MALVPYFQGGNTAPSSISPPVAPTKGSDATPAEPRTHGAPLAVATEPVAPAPNADEPISRGTMRIPTLPVGGEASPDSAHKDTGPNQPPGNEPTRPAPDVGKPVATRQILFATADALEVGSPARASGNIVRSATPSPHVKSPASIQGDRPRVAHTSIESLAKRIAAEKVDRGGIVLFAPTGEKLRVAQSIGDLGRLLSGRGNRVLIFDGRHSAETPTWADKAVPTVTSFLGGQISSPETCFVPTSIQGVEYSCGDLSHPLDGVLAAHRFRQMVEQMQERYSLVLMVSPPVTLQDNDPLLPTLAHGLVLVTESNAPPQDISAYIESITRLTPAPVYGTLPVSRG